MRALDLTPSAERSLSKLKKRDSALYDKTLVRIQELRQADNPDSRLQVKGNPHRLKGPLKQYWGVTTHSKNRIVYKWDATTLYIASVTGHYNDR